MNSKRFLLAMMAVAVLMGSSLAALSERDEEAELHTDAEVSCEDINDTHEFEGDCCSLFDAPDGGCFLNVTNGYCIVKGSIWDLKYTSTFTDADCPKSNITVTTKPPTGPPTMAPTTSSTSAHGLAIAGMLIGSTAALLAGTA